MDPGQMAQQLKHELQTVTWAEGSGSVVFGTRNVIVYAGAASATRHPPGFPFALITIGDSTPDATDPSLITTTFEIAAAVNVAGDPFGELAVIGGARPTAGTSAGAGATEVAERVRSAIQSLTAFDGAPLVVSGTGIGAPAILDDVPHVVIHTFRVDVLCTSQPTYTAPQEFKVVGDIGSWRGEHCSRRFDFLQYRVGFKAGSTPPTSPADCDSIVATTTNVETGVDTLPGRVYAVFADYKRTPSATTVHRSSDPVVGSYITT